MKLFRITFYDNEGDLKTIEQCFDSFEDAFEWVYSYFNNVESILEIGGCEFFRPAASQKALTLTTTPTHGSTKVQC